MRIVFLITCAAFSVLSTAAYSQYALQDGTVVDELEMFQECDVCPEMIVLPLGDFLMGGPPGESKLNIHWGAGGTIRYATADDPYIAHHEGPQHRVTIDLPVAMGRNEITYDEWMACVNDGGCDGYVPQDYIIKARGGRETVKGNHPVLYISYSDALSYVDWLNEKVGGDVYRLPTEAEWEYAARAGTQTPFAQGEEVTTDQVNFLGKPTEEMLGEKRPELLSRGITVPVDELDAANAWGLRHMSGNLSEVTASCWTDRHEGWETSSLHLEKTVEPECLYRVVKGGAFWTAMDFSRLGVRGRAKDATRTEVAGFRVLRDLN